VARDGLWNATVESIARRLGMSKSSLYFYFENRDQMLWEMIDRERHSLGELVLQRTWKQESFEEKLYAYFVLFLRYVWGRPEFLAMMNWFRFQEFEIHPPEDPTAGMENYYRFILEAINEGTIDGERYPKEMVLRFMHFLLMQEITSCYRHGDDIGQLYPVLRSLHQLFLYGIEGA
jgi:AcrR family transcriptional regulator